MKPFARIFSLAVVLLLVARVHAQNSTGVEKFGVDASGNITATLLASGGITPLDGPESYGVLAPGAIPVSRPFKFATSGASGATGVTGASGASGASGATSSAPRSSGAPTSTSLPTGSTRSQTGDALPASSVWCDGALGLAGACSPPWSSV